MIVSFIGRALGLLWIGTVVLVVGYVLHGWQFAAELVVPADSDVDDSLDPVDKIFTV